LSPEAKVKRISFADGTYKEDNYPVAIINSFNQIMGILTGQAPVQAKTSVQAKKITVMHEVGHLMGVGKEHSTGGLFPNKRSVSVMMYVYGNILRDHESAPDKALVFYSRDDRINCGESDRQSDYDSQPMLTDLYTGCTLEEVNETLVDYPDGDREEKLKHTVTINGKTSPQSTDYTIEVSGKIEDHKGIGSREGVVQSSRAEGTVGTGRDKYRFDGKIESISLTNSRGATVLVDGESRDGSDGNGSGNDSSGGDDRLPGSGYHLPASPPDYLNKSCLRGENFGFSPPNPRLIVHKYDADNNCRISNKELNRALSAWTQNDDFTDSELDIVTSAWEWSSGNEGDEPDAEKPVVGDPGGDKNRPPTA
jgi:hypothetical protein